MSKTQKRVHVQPRITCATKDDAARIDVGVVFDGLRSALDSLNRADRDEVLSRIKEHDRLGLWRRDASGAITTGGAPGATPVRDQIAAITKDAAAFWAKK